MTNANKANREQREAERHKHELLRRIKTELLEKYGSKEPHEFMQWDGFHGQCNSRHAAARGDEDRHLVFDGSPTWELMTGAPSVRVLIPVGTPRAEAVALLRKIVASIELDGSEVVGPEGDQFDPVDAPLDYGRPGPRPTRDEKITGEDFVTVPPDGISVLSIHCICADQAAAQASMTLQEWKYLLAQGKVPAPRFLSDGGKTALWNQDEIADWIGAGKPTRAEWETDEPRREVDAEFRRRQKTDELPF